MKWAVMTLWTIIIAGIVLIGYAFLMGTTSWDFEQRVDLKQMLLWLPGFGCIVAGIIGLFMEKKKD